MKCLEILYKFLKKDILKNVVIIIQVCFSVFAATFFLLPIIKNIDSSNFTKDIDLKNIASFSESVNIVNNPMNYYPEKFEQIKNIVRDIDGVKTVNGTYNTQLINFNYPALIYDLKLCDKMKPSLYSGVWFEQEHMDSDIIPIVISYSLKKNHKVGDIIELKIPKYNNGELSNETVNKTGKVIGILESDTYIYVGGSNHSYQGLSDWFQKLNSKNDLVIIPNLINENYWYNAGMGLLIEYDDEQKDFFEIANTSAEKIGIGKIYSIEELKKNDYQNFYAFNEQNIYEFVIIFIFVLVSVGGYNILAILDYKRLLTIYYINGLTWKKGILLIVIRNLIIIMLPVILSALTSMNIICYFRTLYSFEINVVIIISLLYLILCIITTMITILNLKNIKPIEVLKEVD